jgi:hypothetical protein
MLIVCLFCLSYVRPRREGLPVNWNVMVILDHNDVGAVVVTYPCLADLVPV